MTDGYISSFSQLYYCVLVILGHYYLVQLFLAVVLTNLTSIQAAEAFEEIRYKKRQVKKDKAFLKRRK
jgi:hypothetical protein